MFRVLLSALWLACVVCPRAGGETFTVFAAASLTDALQEIGRAHESATGDKARFNFAGTNMLVRQIEAGAPADLFVSADESQMDALQKKGLIVKDSRRELLTNSLVVIATPEGPALHKPADLAGTAVRRIALANPQAVPAGVYARLHLEKLGLWDEVRGKVVPTEHVRAALAAVEAGNAEAAVVYRTDATVSDKVRVACELKAEGGPAISYPAALVAGGRGKAAAARFLKALAAPEAGEVFRKHGFTPIGKE